MLFETTQSHELNLAKSSIIGFFSLSLIPILLSLFLPFIYVLTDIYFLNKINTEMANQLLSYLPFAFIPTILMLLFATGTSSLVTKHIANFDYESAESIAGSGVIWSLIIGTVIGALGFLTLNSIIETPFEISTQFNSYLYPILIGSPFLLITLTYLDLLRAQGNTLIISIISCTSIALNFALNIVANEYSGFMELGIAGATAVSLFVTAMILIITFASGKTEFSVKGEHLGISVFDLFKIIANSSFYFSLVASIAVAIFALNYWITQTNLEPSGIESFKTSFLISSVICLAIFSPCVAILLSYQTLTVFNLTTFIYQRVKSAHKFTIRFIALYGTAICALFIFIPENIVSFLVIDPNYQTQVISLCTFFTLGLTLYFINASWATFLQSQNSFLSANIITWLPTGILIGVIYFAPIFEQYIKISNQYEVIFYSFIAAQFLSSIFAWLRFTYSFYEINKVKIEKAEKVKPIKVTTNIEPSEKATPIVTKKETKSSSIEEEFDNDFISSFSHNDDEQLEEIGDIDEFEQAMKSYNQQMETGNPTASNTLSNENDDNLNLEDTQNQSNSNETKYGIQNDLENEQPTTSKPIDTEEVLNSIPGSDDDFSLDMFSNDLTSKEESSLEKESLDLDLPEFSEVASTNNLEEISSNLDSQELTLDETKHVETLELNDEFKSDLEESEPSKKHLSTQLHLDEELNLDDDIASFSENLEYETNNDELNLDQELESLSNSIESESLEDFDAELSLNNEIDLEPLESINEIELDNLNTDLNTDLSSELSNLEQESSETINEINLNIEPEVNIEENQESSLQKNESNELSSELEKINLEFDELFKQSGTQDLNNLDELISQVDIHNSEPDANTQTKPSNSENNSTDKNLFTAEGDEEIMEIFFEEAEEIFELLPSRIQAFKNNDTDKHLAKELQRDFHTLKGGARMASIDPMGDLCHQYELLFEQLGNGRLQSNDNIFNVIDDGFTEVKQAIKNIESTNQYLFDASLIDKIKAF